tara:strand:+ start:2800 stop:3735 length:936 start_codon:yes stop_codon:yes gene_type:complete
MTTESILEPDSIQQNTSITRNINIMLKNNTQLSNLMLHENFLNNTFFNIRFINKGCDGIVYSAQHRIDNKMYAIKKIPFYIKPNNPNEVVAHNIMNKLKEVRCLSSLEHPNIIKYCTSWIEVDDKNLEMVQINNQNYYSICLYIQTELMDMSLREYLDTYQIDNKTKQFIIKNIVNGVKYLHDNNIIHRDLKPENILLKLNGEKILSIKIADFSLVIHKHYPTIDEYNEVGTPTYAPPENNEGIITKKYDIYSLGIIIFEIMNNFTTHMEKYTEIYNLKKGKNSNKLLCNMINADFKSRPSITDLTKLDKY